MFIGKFIPRPIKARIRQRVLRHYQIPWNPYGIEGVLQEHLSRTNNIVLVDIGASEGVFTERLIRLCGVRNALLVEPQAARCEQLKAKFAKAHATIVCAAVGDREGMIDMEVLNYDYSSSILSVRRDIPEVNASLDLRVRQIIKCRLATLDAICQENNFTSPIDLLKIDVQGAEGMVLTGARNTLARTKALWTEVSFQTLYENSVGLEEMIRLCRSHGFILEHLTEGWRASNGELFQGDALFVRR